MRTSALLLLGAAAAEAFSGAPSLSGVRSGLTSLQMTQAAPPASGKELCKAKIEAVSVNAEQWDIKAEGTSTGTQAPPPASGKELCKAKLEAAEVNAKQWSTGAVAAAAAPAEEMEPVVIEPGVDYIAKLEALSSKYIKKLEAVN